jgi:hypothetical protein
VNCPLEKNAWPPKTAPFEFKYCNVKKVAKIIKGLSNTTAVGADGLSESILKLTTDVLAETDQSRAEYESVNGESPNGL